MIEKKGFYRRFVKAETDPIQHLIEIQKTLDRPIYLVPQLMFFGKKPLPAVPSLVDAFFGTSQRPGTVRKIATLVRQPGSVFVEGATSPYSLMTASKGVYGEAAGEWTAADALGYARILSLPGSLQTRAGAGS